MGRHVEAADKINLPDRTPLGTAPQKCPLECF